MVNGIVAGKFSNAIRVKPVLLTLLERGSAGQLVKIVCLDVRVVSCRNQGIFSCIVYSTRKAASTFTTTCKRSAIKHLLL